ncbi:MAG: TonB-dependent receptor [Candidatus Omnitrophica bacterium]|nr:TonB-dependent receptor [Candidatus Omnitrophota bacterium]
MKKLLFLGFGLLLFSFNFCLADNSHRGGRNQQESAIRLEEIVVTPYRYPQKVQKAPVSIGVITQEDIKKSNAQTIPDVLRTQAGLVVRDYYGTGTRVAVDLRGFGETAGSNTLVLVDGRRVNEIDLSGVDWNQIPLDRVEKIEIARGSHSVLYGDNAVGGVINIITKKGKGDLNFEIDTVGGSYDMNKQKIYLSGSQNEFSYFLGANRHYTKGYRENSFYEGNDFSGRFTYNFSDFLSLGLSGGYNDSDFGLPGALRESDLDNRSRRDTKYPDDEVSQTDWFTDLNIEINPTSDFQINTHFSFRRKKVDNDLRSSSYIWKSNIDTFGFTPSFKLEKEIFGRESVLTGGIDLYHSESEMDDYSFYGLSFYEGSKMRETDINKKTIGYYLQNEISLFDYLIFNAGYRYEKAKYSFNSQPISGAWTMDPFWSDTKVNEKLSVSEEALNVGLNYIYNDFSRLFIRFSKGYRLPATDEYYSIWAAPPVNTDLCPQSFDSYEIGLAHGFSSNISIELTLFNMNIKNELYYDPISFENRNYDKTRHRGVEFGFSWKPLEQLSFLSSYTYTSASFRGGDYNRNQIPMVPHHKASLSSTWQINKNWQLSTVLNYTGRRYFISDQSNEYPKMKDYLTVDLKGSYRFGNNRVFAGINDVFDKKYSEYGAISTMYNERGYYPSPGRNFIAGCSFRF